MKKNIYILGDTHGNVQNLIGKIKSENISNALIISVGDMAIGFPYWLNMIEALDQVFNERNIEMIIVRGNHDNPSLFDGSYVGTNKTIELIADYSTRVINGEKFLFVGGGISVDRIRRIECVDYWEDEYIKPIKHPIECDVLITHCAPQSIVNEFNGTAVLDYWKKVDPSISYDLQRDDMTIVELINKTQPKKHFFGHYHTSGFVSEVIQHQCLNIDELHKYTND